MGREARGDARRIDGMSEPWFVEKHTPYVGITLAVEARLFDRQSGFQKVEVLQTEGFGRMLLLDGAVMLTERDEFIYHEMLVHPALFGHPRPQRVLIVGGGDGGSAREALKHERVRDVTLVEIDPMVIEVCRRFFPALAACLDDPRVNVKVQDGFEFLDQHRAEFDAILVDSTDPVPLAVEGKPGPAERLFTPRFYAKLREALRPGGLVAFQSENPFYSGKILAAMHGDLRAVFGKVALYLAHIPTYPAGFWSFTVASDEIDLHGLRVDPVPGWIGALRYFQPAMFPGALVLPRYIEQLISG
jgi:spermidine synthase